jgi:hypothetical protein
MLLSRDRLGRHRCYRAPREERDDRKYRQGSTGHREFAPDLWLSS